MRQIDMLVKDLPERDAMQQNRRSWNQKAKASSSIDLDTNSVVSEEQKVYPFETCDNFDDLIAEHHVHVIDDRLFNKFDPDSKHTIFGYIRESEHILNGNDSYFFQQIPNNIHYLVLLYYYLMENEFDGDALLLWKSRADISEFMNTTLVSTRDRIWDKFDKQKKNVLSTEKYLPKFIYTISVLFSKSKQRKSTPPKYASVKNCAKYMSLLMIQTLPIDQKRYMDKQHFVANIHVYLSAICT
eukprot:CAMPEP_0202721654 /NCGR_PEP_ID=MMETSP1385-20130828/150534_1 /ASSEMBLY_ACC=CAM_ASM_000861 /TAXON_ID=933848 /ORGANISM="Elphidium margaritaceum" /LENGTH=241 /DNA_ID=CAMNT_0049385949 /DNA_START=12 /DNA_END=737 /DNA_ORIENTATION=+